MSAVCAPRMEQKIVEVPKNQMIVALVYSEPLLPSGIDFQENPAIHQQGQKFKSTNPSRRRAF